MNHLILHPVGDQFGRHELLAAVMLSVVVVSLVQMRSVWPSWAWSVRASFDTQYETVFKAERFALVDVTASVLDRAAELRAHHRFGRQRTLVNIMVCTLLLYRRND